jgi:hypothetical protein
MSSCRRNYVYNLLLLVVVVVVVMWFRAAVLQHSLYASRVESKNLNRETFFFSFSYFFIDLIMKFKRANNTQKLCNNCLSLTLLPFSLGTV